MFPIPSLDQCVQKTRAAFRSYLPGTDAWVWPNNIGPTAKVVGGAVSELYGRLDWIGRQSRVVTASGQYLDRHGAQYNLPRKTAQTSVGNVILTSAGAVTVANGATFVRSDGVQVVATAALVATGAGALTVPVVAAVAALAGNSQPNTPLTILSGVTGVGAVGATAAVDANGLTGGLDVEADGPFYSRDTGTYRGRILFRLAFTPHGGAPSDYVLWCGTIPGCTRVFVERLWNGRGSIRIFPLFDTLFAATGGVPDAAHIALVQAYLASVQPADAEVTVVAATPTVINVAVQGLTPNTTAVQQAVLFELADTFQRLGQVAGNDAASGPIQAALPFLAVPYTFSAIWIDQAIANATGDKRAVVLSPTSDIAISAGSIPVLGSVTFT